MLYFSSLLNDTPKYLSDAKNLFSALSTHGELFGFLHQTKDIWSRDYMPVKTRSGTHISFRYEPSYAMDTPQRCTDYRRDISSQFELSVIYSDINLDGGNVVFSPSKEKAIISDRIFLENSNWKRSVLTAKLSELLEAEIIIIESLKSDLTGHADGMVRFLSEDTVLINKTEWKNGLEQRQARCLSQHGFHVIEFPYDQCGTENAKGCYLNYIETSRYIFLPIFDIESDTNAQNTAVRIFQKKIVPVELHAIPKEGGVLNCISWEL
ncbi:agmatine deiminase family protein [Phocea massiliensis]|uniref:Agmatine deiminase family protein n=1 Tax=Merdimmobilis hominis TaxID=2897707 RepID=A0A938X8J1_9FIRM|nr:agmatine deiminase family protein [Merdimmobilis hominis]MBM6921813.1 agmatine deiminase family protein [Merdimmobilis hominis]